MNIVKGSVQDAFTNSQSGNTSSILNAIHGDFKKDATDIWNTVNNTKRKHVKQPVVQKQQPIPTIVKRYVLPNIHHEDSEDSHSSGMVGKKICKTKKQLHLQTTKNRDSNYG